MLGKPAGWASNVPRYLTQSLLLRHLLKLKIKDSSCFSVPGHLRLIEGLFLYDEALKVPAGGVVLEIGAYLGRSTAFMGAALESRSSPPTIHVIDTFTSIGVPETEGKDTLNIFTRNMAPFSQLIRIHQGFSSNIVRNWSLPIDMLWIDGDHAYSACSEDILSWVPFVRRGGLVAFHDYANPCGVAAAVDEHLPPFVQVGSGRLNGSIYYARKA